MNVAIVGAGVIAQGYAERIADVDGLTLVVHDGRIEHVFASDTPPVDVVAWLREHPA